MSLSKQQLYTMRADGSDVQLISSRLRGVSLAPPAWSPDGRRFALVVGKEKRHPNRYVERKLVLYTVRSDGSELVKIGEVGDARIIGSTIAEPTWSPNGKRLAFVRETGQESIIHTVRFDGEDLRQIWSSGPYDDDSHRSISQAISQVSWSPDGSELLFIFAGEIYTVGPEGTGLRKFDIAARPGQAAWSPDGSKIAIYYPSSFYHDPGQVLTIARDGTDLRILVEEDSKGRFHVATEVGQ